MFDGEYSTTWAVVLFGDDLVVEELAGFVDDAETGVGPFGEGEEDCVSGKPGEGECELVT